MSHNAEEENYSFGCSYSDIIVTGSVIEEPDWHVFCCIRSGRPNECRGDASVSLEATQLNLDLGRSTD